MKIFLSIVALVVFVIGVISTLDGVNVFHIQALGSHHIRWMALGILLLIIGIIVFVFANRKQSRAS